MRTLDDRNDQYFIIWCLKPLKGLKEIFNIMSLTMNKPNAINFQRLPKRNIMVRVNRAPPLNPTQKKQVKRMVKADEEIKTNFQLNGPTALVANTWLITAQQQPAVGTADNQRIGDDVMLQSIKYRYLISPGASGSEVRVVFFQWFPFTSPSIANIFNASTFYGNYNVDNASMYRILSDKVIHNATIDVTRSVTREFNKIRKSQNYALGGTNLIYIAFCSTAAGSVTGSVQLNYTDA